MKKEYGLILAFIAFPVRAADSEEPVSLLIEGGIEAILALKDDFYIEVDDQVDDGCLPQPSRLKDKMEISLRQNGYSIESERSLLGNNITISALGYGTGDDSCAIVLRAALSFYNLVTVPYSTTVPSGQNTLAPIEYQIGSAIFTGGKNGMQSRLEEKTAEFGNDLFLKISRSKDLVQESFPEIIQFFEEQQKTP